MIPEGTEAAQVTAEQIAQVAQDVEVFIKANKIAVKTVAKAIGYSPSVVSEFLGGRYAGNKGQVAIDLEAWLVEEESRRQRPQTTTFTWTNVAQQIKSVAYYCLDYKKIGMIYGPETSGLGKTTTLRALYQEMGPRRSTLVTIDKVDSNPTGMLRKICQAMHIGDTGSTNACFNRICEHLEGRSHLLMVDQAHNMRFSTEDKPFYILADLFDRTETAQLWCGTSDLVGYLQRQQGKTLDEPLAQIRRRIFPCVDLMESVGAGGDGGEPLVSIENIREMFAKNKLRLTPAATRWLCQFIHIPNSGAIGMAVNIVEYATVDCEMHRIGMIDVQHLKSALRRGTKPDRAELILQRLDAAVSTQRIAAAG